MVKCSILNAGAIRGFTLIELLVAVTVLGILTSLALPSFQQLIINNQVATETNGLVSDLAVARSEALRINGAPVTVCASSDGVSCSGVVSDWAKGRLIFVESDMVGTMGVLDIGESIIRTSSASEKLSELSAGFSTDGYLTYNARGTITSTTPGTITVCRSGYSGRVLSVSPTGRVSLSKTSTDCP